ncbi:hypothetical protein [Marinobacter daqiaonensis]|uniref:hypothetical protein n=1 Tax=Marinobacter daqiaonensis TaxID=650891 RepID=UPI00143282CA|nr:hypothetical protein [Marinobacter daqiaonensis]
MIDGKAIVEGDIVLGDANALDHWTSGPEQPAGQSQEGHYVTQTQELATVDNPCVLLPGGDVL